MKFDKTGKNRHIFYTTSTTKDLNTKFRNGKLAMTIIVEDEFPYISADLSQEQVGISSLPAGPGGKANFIGGGAWCINGLIQRKLDKAVSDGNKDAEAYYRLKKKAAWEYISYLCSDEARKIMTRIYVESGWPAFAKPRNLKKFGYSEYLKVFSKQYLEATADLEKYGRIEPFAPAYQNVQTTVLSEPLGKVLSDPKADPARELKKAVRTVNNRFFGEIDPKVMNHRRRIGWVLTIIAAILIIYFFIRNFQALGDESGTGVTIVRSKSYYRNVALAVLFMLPALAAIGLFKYYPLVRGSVMAFQNYEIIKGAKYIGIDNFIDAFTQDIFRKAALNTFIYVGMSLALGFVVPIILAILLNEVPTHKILFRTLFYLPSVTSGLIIMFLWKELLYDPTPNGVLNKILIGMGAIRVDDPAQWLNSTTTFLHIPVAMICIILPGIWAQAGAGCLIYLAALKSIPEAQYEAADLDGANPWQKIRHITIPTLKPLIIINLVGAFIGAFQATQNIFVMTGGGPINLTYTLGLDIFYNAFLYLKFGYATAVAWILGSMIIGFTLYQLRILKSVKFSAGERK